MFFTKKFDKSKRSFSSLFMSTLYLFNPQIPPFLFYCSQSKNVAKWKLQAQFFIMKERKTTEKHISLVSCFFVKFLLSCFSSTNELITVTQPYETKAKIKSAIIIFLFTTIVIASAAPEPECPEFCLEIYQPVCGQDIATNALVTFSNSCSFNSANCPVEREFRVFITSLNFWIFWISLQDIIFCIQEYVEVLLF